MAKAPDKPEPVSYAEMERALFDAAFAARQRGETRKGQIYEAMTRALRYIQRGEFHVFRAKEMRDRVTVTENAPYGKLDEDISPPGKA